MPRYFLVLITMSLVLSGCATAPALPVGGRFAWDGLGRDPNGPVRRHKQRLAATTVLGAAPKVPEPNAERERVLATLRPYSAAWWVVRDEIEAEDQKRINGKMVICRTCFPPASHDEYTASVRRP
jgi:hypothetical protein